ncbi:hypothetical protein CHELA20_50369 [Hyphomicrobiales bacterium]|nr:hypothetical protein CHELA20_50369 [Hyphomicrobiales bacterium]
MALTAMQLLHIELQTSQFDPQYRYFCYKMTNELILY